MLFSPDEKMKPLEPYSRPAPPPRWPEPLLVREHVVWLRRPGAPLYRMHCIEMLHGGGFCCYHAVGFKQPRKILTEGDGEAYLGEHMSAMLQSPPQLYPSLEEAVKAFDLTSIGII